MKAWTHRVLCEEFVKTHGLDYAVFATLCADGVYRLAERRFGMFPYGMVLTNVRIEETRAQHDKRHRGE